MASPTRSFLEQRYARKRRHQRIAKNISTSLDSGPIDIPASQNFRDWQRMQQSSQLSSTAPNINENKPSWEPGIENPIEEDPIFTVNPHHYDTPVPEKFALLGQSVNQDDCSPEEEKKRLLSNYNTILDTSDTKSSTLQTGFNVVNMYVGLGLLSKGYAVSVGGWLSLIVLLISLIVFLYTAKLITKGFDKIPPNIEPTYANLGLVAAGKVGQIAVVVAVLLEFFGAVCMCLIVTWQNMFYILPGTNQWIIVAAVTGAIFPTVLIKSYAKISFISLIGFISSIFVVTLVIYWFLQDTNAVFEHKNDLLINFSKLPVASGIYLISLSGHAILPSLRKSMKKPQEYSKMMNICFAIMGVTYFSMAIFSYLSFGENNRVLITQNLNLAAKGLVEVSINKFVTAFVAFGSYATIAPGIAVLTEMITELFPKRNMDTKGFKKSIQLYFQRTVVFLLIVGLSLISFDYLAYVEALIGVTASTTTSLIFPTLFYYMLYKNELKALQKLVCLTILIGGTIIAVILTIFTTVDLIANVEQIHPL